MSPAELKFNVSLTGSNFFDRKSMKFFGDTMANYGVSAKPVSITQRDGTNVECWELYRKRPVKHGLNKPAYFCTMTFKRIFKPI